MAGEVTANADTTTDMVMQRGFIEEPPKGLLKNE
jgi:hypothetical protein